MRDYGKFKLIPLGLLLFAILYVTYLFERKYIINLAAEKIATKELNHSVLEKIALNEKRNNESILIPLKKSIENLQKKLRTDSIQLASLQIQNNRNEILMNELVCELEDAHTQVTILQSSNDSLQRSTSQLWASQKVTLDKKFKELDKKISYVTVKTDARKLNFSDSLKLVFLNSKN